MEAYKQIPLEGMRSQKRGKEIGDNQTSPGDGVAEMLGRLKLFLDKGNNPVSTVSRLCTTTKFTPIQKQR
jgi:hypothetical protein